MALGQPQGANSYHVQVLKGDKVEQRLIQVGINDRQFVEVKEGLKAGDRVIVTGLQKVRPGAQVKAQEVTAENKEQAPAGAQSQQSKS